VFANGRDPIWYCSLVHFVEPISAARELVEWVDAHGDVALGGQEFHSVALCTWRYDGRAMAPQTVESVIANSTGAFSGRRNELGPLAEDGVEVSVVSNGGDWLIAWHPPDDVPDGHPHGANALCVTESGADVILISTDGDRWGWPGGRPEAGESWEDVLRREVREEACSEVLAPRLLGFIRAGCVSGQQAGTTLVRSQWRAVVRVGPWEPQHEISHRELVRLEDLPRRLWIEDGFAPVYARAAHEAGLLPLVADGGPTAL
jgi:hypothetical protein